MQGTQAPLMSTLIWFGMLAAVFYFMLIRPQQNQKKKREQMLASLRKGNRIVTIGGLHGEILDLKDDSMLVNVSDGPEKVVVRMAKWAANEVLGKPDQAS